MYNRGWSIVGRGSRYFSGYFALFLSAGIMAVMSDATILTNHIISVIYKSGGYAWRQSSTGIYDAQRGGYRTAPKTGVSDVLGLLNGRLVAVEVKVGKDRLRPEQIGFIENVRHYGGIAIIAKTPEQFNEEWEQTLPLLTSSQGIL